MIICVCVFSVRVEWHILTFLLPIHFLFFSCVIIIVLLILGELFF